MKNAERILWQTVVVRALTDATAPNPSSVHDRRAKDEADTWVRDCRRDFRLVCALAGFDPDFISEAYRAGRVDGDLLRASDKARGPAA